MAKAILEFDLNEVEDVTAHKRAVKALDMAMALWDMDQYLRQQLKYNDKITGEVYDALDKAREQLRDFMNNHNVDLDELLN
jgi:cell fate (sporulation/competence/biofilm development) regulator YlbF (YheA/YmcA/DUF963 family)